MSTSESGNFEERVLIVKQNNMIANLRVRDSKANEAIERFCKGGMYKRNNSVFDALDESLVCSAKDQFVHLIPAGTTLYRARKIEDADMKSEEGIQVDDCFKTRGFDEQGSMEPPLGKGGAGRNNIAGMSYLYLAEDKATACAEIKVIPKDAVSLAEICTKNELRVYYIPDGMYTTAGKDGQDLGAIMSEICRLFYRPVSNSKEYKATQVISDYIRKMGFDGLSYRSYYTGKRNYTIFNSHPGFFEFVDSRIVIAQGSVQYFWDENDRTCIKSEYINLDYEANHSQDVLEFIRKKTEP